MQLVATVAWWASVIGAYLIAQRKGRNRFGWVVAAAFVPLIAVGVVALLPARRVARNA